MYANLKVKIAGDATPIAAWKIVIPAGTAIQIHTDLNDGEGNYAGGGPVLQIVRASDITITADF